MAGIMDTQTTELPKLPDLTTGATTPAAPSLSATTAPSATTAATPTTTATTPDITPVTRTIDPSKETVAGQLDTLTAKESPLMTRARTGAMQAANARGLMNSSIAAGAGEAAAIDSALPIATADANLYGVAARDNQIAQNQFGIQKLQSASAKELLNIEAQYKTVMQGTASASQVMAAAQAGINDILKDTTLSNDAKTALVKKVNDGLRAQMGVIGAMSGMDLSGLLVFPEPAATTPPAGTPAGTPAAPAAGAPITASTPGAVRSPFGNYYIPGQQPAGNLSPTNNSNLINARGGTMGR